MSTRGLRCPQCRGSLEAALNDRCPRCGEPFDPVELRGIERKYPGTIVLPGWIRRYGLPVAIILVGAGIFAAGGGGGRLMGVGFAYLLISMFFDPWG